MKSIQTIALAAALSLGVSGIALAQATSPGEDGAASGTTGGEMSTSGETSTSGGSMSSSGGSMSSSGGEMASEGGDMVEVGGAPMYANKTIAENAPNASNLTTLVAAVQAAGLVETLGGEGPFTVFAPDNAAFEKLPAGTVDTLLEEGNRDQLTSILTYHVVPAEATSEAAMQMIEDDGGEHEVTTVEGGTLTLKMDGDNLTVTDEEGNVATVTQADVMQSNGVVHVIDTVLMPSS